MSKEPFEGLEPRFSKVSIDDVFFIDGEFRQILHTAGIDNLNQLAGVSLRSLVDLENIGAGRIEGIARMLRVFGVNRGDLFLEADRRKKKGGIDPLVLGLYRQVGVTLDGSLEVRRLNRPYEGWNKGKEEWEKEYDEWMSDDRLREWHELRLSMSGNPDKRKVSLLISGASGIVTWKTSLYDFSKYPENDYLTLDLLRQQTPETLAGIAARSGWRAVHNPKAAGALLHIFKR